MSSGELITYNEEHYIISKRIDDIMLNSNLISTITNVMPEIDKVYNDNFKKNNEPFSRFSSSNFSLCFNKNVLSAPSSSLL